MITNLKKSIFVTTKIEGFHKYPNAPDEVSFLRNLHRHMFGIKVRIEVYHNERELEFIIVKQDLIKYLETRIKQDENNSCETLAESIHKYITLNYCYETQRLVWVEVDEDGENGASVFGDVDYLMGG